MNDSISVCKNCDTPVIDAVIAVVQGKAGCCPECTTLTVAERNKIREDMRDIGNKLDALNE